MSLATTGGGMAGAGAGGGGMAMAHHAGAVARPAAPNAPPGGSVPPGMAPPSSAAAALGADIVDKQQQLSLKHVKDTSHMPLVAVDLYAKEPHVAMFPPKPKDPSEARTLVPAMVGKMKSKIALEPNEVSHKTLRKWLSKSKGYVDMQNDTLAKSDDPKAISIENPQQWLGLRRLEDAPEHLKNQHKTDDSTSPAIAEDSSQDVGVVMVNGTLDGSAPQGDDFDRVACQVRLTESKKALTMLPEEAVQLLFNVAQYHVSRKSKVEDPEEIVDYPCCVAVPSPYCNDRSMEALLDSMGGSGVVYQRSVCALAGALIPGQENSPNFLISHLDKVLQARQKKYTQESVKNPDAKFQEELVVLLLGLTSDTIECTAIQLSAPQNEGVCCLYGNYKVICNVAYRLAKPDSIINKVIGEVYEQIELIAPEATNPVAMVSYGSLDDQKTIEIKWEKTKKNLEDWENIDYFKTKGDCVSQGTAILGAVSHGRLSKIAQVPGKKPKKVLAMTVDNVAPVAVGVQLNYHGGAKNKWEEPKTIFDFDRRVPAGPYQIELNAAECAVYHSGDGKKLTEEQLLKAITANEGSKNIPKREQAALNLRVQVLQKFTRDGDWQKIGDAMSPLVEVDKDENKIACEKLVFELSLGASGMITHALVGDRYVHVQPQSTCSLLRPCLIHFVFIHIFDAVSLLLKQQCRLEITNSVTI